MTDWSAGAALRIEVEGDREIGRALRRLRRRMKDLTPVMDSIGRRLMTSTDMRFKTGVDPDGEPWPKSRAARDRGLEGSVSRRGLTLVDTGRLRQSITRRASEDEVVVGTNVAYAAIHQFGGKTPPRRIVARRKKALHWPGARHPVRSVMHPGSKVPKRAFLGVSRGDEDAIFRIVERELKKAWK